MKLKFFFVLIIMLIKWSADAFSQTSGFHRYIVEFTDKNNNPYSIDNPSAFLSQRAIDRRNRYDISITESDLPVNPDYVQQVMNTGVKVLNKSKWLNSISIETDDSLALLAIQLLPFVRTSYPIAPRFSNGGDHTKTEFDFYPQRLNDNSVIQYGQSSNQIDMLRGDALHKQGYHGESIIIAVFDVGFFNAPNLNVFDSLFQQGRVLGWWNFVQGNDSVFASGGHGSSVLSTIAANIPGIMVGTAPGISVYLFQTEDGTSEYPIEEHNWAAAAERADSVGADMITSSLGYSKFDNAAFNHTYEQMDGNTTMVTRAADYAAGKGMIVCNSAGNEGKKEWFYITAPADADSIITVGAVDSLGLVTGFSSHGPSSSGAIKPNVVAQGIMATVVEPFSGTIVTSNGTSFSNPIIAGMTACLWQAHPDKNNMEVISAIEESASLYFDPNDSMGYGIPNYEVADLILSGKAPDNLALSAPLIYPNPFQDNFGILYYTARLQQVNIELFNILGEKVQSFESTLQIGYNYLPVYLLNRASNGIYFVRLNFDDHREVVRVLKIQP